MGLGLVVCYAFGTVWFLLVYTGGGSAATLLGALTLCVFPYILPRPGEDRPGPGPDPAGGEVRAGMTFL